ncbi:DNA translocase [Bacillus sp. 349Y]|nr:DNA translocase [Bacillus sp. 349Y]
MKERVIDVSWIKKIIGKFSDVDDSYEEYVDDEVQRPVGKQAGNPAAPYQRDVEARMTYQYPKGNFRFPLIGDGEGGSRERRTRDRDKKEVTEKQPERPKREKKRVERPRKEAQPKPVHQSTSAPSKTVTSKVQKGKGTRPFKPTEIPSPIYGFRERPIKKQEVEYELGNFLHSHPPASVNVPDVREEPLPVPPVHHDVPEVEARTEEAVDFELHESKSPSDEYDVAPITETVTEERSEELSSPVPDEEVFDAAGTLDMTDAPVSIGGVEEREDARFEDQTKSALSDEYVEHVTPVVDTEGKTAPLHAESREDRAEAVSEHDAGAESAMPVEEFQEERQQKKRTHLPFNVLMLNQDKRSMSVRRQQPAPSPNVRVQRPQVEEPVEEQPERQHEMEQTVVQGEEAVKSYSELSSSTKTLNEYEFPSLEYLNPPVSKTMSEEWLDTQSALLDETLLNFNVRARVVNVTQGPSVTRFEVQPEPGVKVNKITNLSDDIKLSLAAKDIRIEAPIPGKHTIGIEVPNRDSRPVCISEVIASPAFQEADSPLTAALGLDISGQPIVTDLSKMPHGLIAGATGSGKSVCINSILVSLLYKSSPDELKMMLIDPKMVELAPYNRIPHLVSPVITDVKAATAALKWAVEEMERRYELFAHTGVRDIKRFNELATKNKQYSDKLPYLVIVIDELADLMMMSPADVEEAICRIAQKARACGIHLIIATQRPSVDVITGLIKANVPTRVAFSVSSAVDSRTIIDGSGAERLLGRGDMLFLENGSSKPVRLQGTFVSDDEIDDIISHVRDQRAPHYLFEQDELLKKAQVTEEEDELFLEACEFVVDQGGASASSLQRRFRIGYNRAARLMEMMENNGIISEARGSKPRDVLISETELETLV